MPAGAGISLYRLQKCYRVRSARSTDVCRSDLTFVRAATQVATGDRLKEEVVIRVVPAGFG
jgi:hypothetical protein